MNTLSILLADDDPDDCFLFNEAVAELGIKANITTVNNGEKLMDLLNESEKDLPDIIFLDLNMPRKNGYDCLDEIKDSSKLSSLPVIIYSTAFDPEIVKRLKNKGGVQYLRKPTEFNLLKAAIRDAITAAIHD